MSECIDLLQVFGDLYQIAYEESRYTERGDGARSNDPWMQIIPCRFGHIYPHGGQHLAASTNCRGPATNRLAALDCVSVLQNGDDGINAKFHVDDMITVAAVMCPKRRRRLTPEQRAERIERLRKYQFTAATQTAGDARRGLPGIRATDCPTPAVKH